MRRGGYWRRPLAGGDITRQRAGIRWCDPNEDPGGNPPDGVGARPCFRNGIFWIRQRMDRKSNVAIGTPDILGVRDGIPFAWECKMDGRNPTPEQVAAMEHMSRNGWRTAIVRSYDEARSLFESLNP